MSTIPGSVYLDYNATAPIRPQVIAAVAEAMSLVGNASSIHRDGRMARSVLEKARKQLANLVGCQTKQVTFTSGGTESCNIAIMGGNYDRVLVGATEHDCVRTVHPNTHSIPVLPDGTLNMDILVDMLAQSTNQNTLVCVMHANNETGVVNPISTIALHCAMAGAKLHVDAIQTVGKIPVDFVLLGCQSMSLSAHKLGGPQGVGALIADPAMNLLSLQRGGGQEQGVRAGTENVAGIAGFGVACDLARDALKSDYMDRIGDYRITLENKLVSALGEHIIVVGQNTDRIPNTSCIIAPTVKATTQLMNLDLNNIMVSSGSACSSGTVKPSHVLMAMGFDSETANCAIRISMGWQTTLTDIELFLKKYIPIINKIIEK